MVKLKEIPRTATFAWSPDSQLPFLASGTVAGAVDADFSSKSVLELWDLDLVNKSTSAFQLTHPLVSVGTDARFHDLIWANNSPARPKGIIAGGLDNGALMLWDADALLKDKSGVLLNSTDHTGAIKSLDFNPIQTNLLVSAGAKGEILVWDIERPGTPVRPGTASSRVDEIESVAWNNTVAHILAAAGSTGFTSVWDLKNKREVLHLYFPGPGGGGRRGVSSVVWHPDNSTKLITASEDDNSPVILMWDLRNANAPEKILTGHEKGILSLSWCKRDSDLLLSSGKDNRTLLWNPNTGDLLGEFPIATNWTFETRWYERNPELFASASFDGKITVQSLQNTNKPTPQVVKPEGTDFWNTASYVDSQQPTFSLKQPPKWLRRPVAASFGFGGKFVTVQLEGPHKSKVKINKFAIESQSAAETEKFEEALKSQNLSSIAETRAVTAQGKEKHDWTVLLALYEENPKQKLLDFLGYDDLPIQSLSLKDTNGKEPSLFADESAEDPFLNISKPISGAFTIFNDDTKAADKEIAQALLLGKFSTAVDICLKDDRLSDAFMLALSGDDECRQKVQKAYFKHNAEGPSYIRILSSIVDKNLSDLVRNADIGNWKEVVVALCTYADDSEFSTLIAELGNRLSHARTEADADTSLKLRDSAALCFLAGAKLEKLTSIWIEELAEAEKAALSAGEDLSPFAIHIKSLQDFIEKVTVFRNAVKYRDDGEKHADEWTLAPLYEAYREYANIVASQGFLELAQKYLSLLPTQYPLALIEQERVTKAVSKRSEPAASVPAAAVPAQTSNSYTPYAADSTPTYANTYQPPASTYAPPASSYAPPASSYAQPTNSYDPTSAYGHAYRSSVTIPAPPPLVTPPIHHQQQHEPLPPPPTSHSHVNKDVGGWNDAPVLKPSSRKATPAVSPQPILSPFPGMQQVASNAYAPPSSTTPALARGPQNNIGPPPINAKPPQSVPVSPVQSPPPPPKSSAYAPTPKVEFVSVAPTAPPPATQSKYAPPPSDHARPVNPYAVPPPQQTQRPHNPYAPVAPAQPTTTAPSAPPSAYAPSAPQTSYTPNSYNAVPHLPGPPSVARTASPAQSVIAPPTSAPKHPAGDRSHIPASALPIYQILSAEMARVKQKIPASVSRQVNDAEKRLNMLFDHLNNQDLLSEETVRELVILAEAIRERDFETAYAVHVNLITTRTDECGHWMTGVKRLIDMSRQC